MFTGRLKTEIPLALVSPPDLSQSTPFALLYISTRSKSNNILDFYLIFQLSKDS